MLMNDCSARDIQQWEYVPLGPFNGKNFVRAYPQLCAALSSLSKLHRSLLSDVEFAAMLPSQGLIFRPATGTHDSSPTNMTL